MTNIRSASAILRELVAIPSQNPMGAAVEGDGWFEAGMTDWLGRFFHEINVPCEYHEVEPGRGNVVAVLPGNADRPCTLLDAHTDTVPVAGMTIAPFTPFEQEGRLFGRGSCDVKGSLAVMLELVQRLKADPAQMHGTIIFSCTCDEERTQKGAADLIRRLESQRHGLLATVGEIDQTVVFEPTGLNPVVAHKGAARWKVQTDGEAVHSSDPSRGINAIYRMAEVVRALEQYSHLLKTEVPAHHLCGGATMSVGRIAGGSSVNIVPDCCRIEIDRRVVPGEEAAAAIAAAETWLRANCETEFEFLPPDTISQPLNDTGNAELAEKLIAAASGIVEAEAIGVPYGTHASRFALLGMPTVVFGPGDIAQAHTKDEWIEVKQLEQAVEILLKFLSLS